MILFESFSDQSQIDAEYDVRAAEDDADGLLADHFQTSESWRSTAKAFLGLPYGPTVEEYLDVYPAERAGAPVLVFFHGGWWSLPIYGPQHALCARGPVQRGVTTVIVNYALAPAVSLSEITRQARASLVWTFRNIAKYGGDPNRIVVSGHSAGGQIAASLVLTNWTDDYGLPASVIKAAVPISGLFDLEIFRYSWLAPKLLLDAETVHRQSPLRHVRKTGIEMLVTLGSRESAEFHRQSQRFAEAWIAAGNPGSMVPIEDHTHLSIYASFAQPDSELTTRTLELIRRCA